MKKKLSKSDKRKIRHRRVVAKIYGTPEKPRLSVFKSNNNLYAQIIDDVSGKTIIGVSSIKIKEKMKISDKAKKVGEILGELAIKNNIKNVVFDRGGFKYHGRIKAVAEGARSKGLNF